MIWNSNYNISRSYLRHELLRRHRVVIPSMEAGGGGIPECRERLYTYYYICTVAWQLSDNRVHIMDATDI